MRFWLAPAFVLLTGCGDRAERTPPPPPVPETDLARAQALRDRAPSATARWPPGTTFPFDGLDNWLFHVAVVGEDVFAVTRQRIVRMAADGKVATIAEASDRTMREATVAGGRLIVTDYPLNPGDDGVAGGQLVAFAAPRFARTVLGPAILYDELVGSRDRLIVAREKTLLLRKGPKLDRELEHATLEHYPKDIVVDGAGALVWHEMISRADDNLVRLADGERPRTITTLRPVDMVVEDSTVYALVIVGDDARTAPGGGDYVESTFDVVAIDLATGGRITLVPGLVEAWSIAIGGRWLCVVEGGPKLGFNKATTVYAIDRATGASRELATGITNARCMAGTDDSFFVAFGAAPWLAKVPI